MSKQSRKARHESDLTALQVREQLAVEMLTEGTALGREASTVLHMLLTSFALGAADVGRDMVPAAALLATIIDASFTPGGSMELNTPQLVLLQRIAVLCDLQRRLATRPQLLEAQSKATAAAVMGRFLPQIDAGGQARQGG